jgi:hypothetical protein
MPLEYFVIVVVRASDGSERRQPLSREEWSAGATFGSDPRCTVLLPA